MSHTQHTVAGALKRSNSHDEIVTVIVSDIEVAFAELIANLDTENLDTDYDYVDTRGPNGEPLREVWSNGGDDMDMDWRVHLLQSAGEWARAPSRWKQQRNTSAERPNSTA